MINAIYIRADQRKISALVKELGYLSDQTFLRSLPLAQFERRALRYLQAIFPKSDNPGPHLVDGWRSDAYLTETKVAFKLFHKDQDDPQIKTILEVLDKGHGAFSWVVKNFARFPNKKTGEWTTLAPGMTVNQPAVASTDYQERTFEFITQNLLPEMRDMIRERVKNRMARL